MKPEAVEFRLTVEALRAGVATKAAAKHVGTSQLQIMEGFRERMSDAESGSGVAPFVIGGPFGSGKSHFLQCLRCEALAAGYAVSLISVGPEAPLNRLDLVVRALANASEAQGVVGKAIRELAILQRIEGEPFEVFVDWVKNSGLDPRFAALVDLYRGYYADDEFRLRIVDDFEGRAMPRGEIRSRLRRLGIHEAQAFTAVSATELAPQRLRLLPQFLRSCGLKGWVVLFDEVEVLGRFGLRQRIAAYENLGRIAKAALTAGSQFIPVFASTDGSYLELMAEDEAQIAGSLYGAADLGTTRLARQGIELFKAVSPLIKPDRNEAMEIMYRVKTIYDAAYDIQSPEPRFDNELLGYQLRTQIRNWVTQWDLHRHYPHGHVAVLSGEPSFHTETIGEDLQVNERDLDD